MPIVGPTTKQHQHHLGLNVAPASALTEITGVSYSNIRRGGSTIHDTGAGEWECFPKRPCTNFSMLEVGA